MLKTFFASMILLGAFSARAAKYDCQLILVLEDPAKGFVHRFTVDETNNAAHGGQVFEFSQDGHEIAFMANDRWLGLNWKDGERVIAQAVFVVTDENQHRAAIVYDPAAPEDRQLSLDCRKQETDGP